MMLRHFARRLVLPLSLLLLAAWMGLAQEPGFLEGKKLESKEDARFRQLHDGKQQLSASGSYDEADKKLLDKAAKFYAGRLTEPWYQGKQAPLDKKTMNQIVDEAMQQIVIPDPGKKLEAPQLEYMRLFGNYLTTHLKFVVKNPEAITRINAARLLAQLCKAGNEDAADALVEVLRDPNESDAVKLYCLRGLRELFSVKQPAKDREPRLISAVIDFLKQKSEAKAELPEEELDAIRYVRREASRTLGQVRYPALERGGKVEGVAWWLLKVARKDGIEPRPNLPEQLEAVIAFCQLQPKLYKEINLDYAAWNLAWALVDFASASNNRNSLPPTVPWKVAAARLDTALDQLRANAEFTADKNSVNAILTLARAETVVPVISGTPARPAKLEEWLTKNPPKNTTLYRGVAESTLKPPEPGK